MAACLSKDNPPSKTRPSAGGCVGRRGTRYHERMKIIAAFLIALLLVASPAAAQSSLEADMREAAAAYERKDMATAARLWKIWADKGNARAQNDIGFMLGFEGPPPHDDVEAYKWLTLAIERYTARNQDRLDQA